MNEWIARLLGLVITVISPELKKEIENLITILEEKAKKTVNPWDDILVGLLKSILFIK
ncbi:unnamed protein product [marine sediment metagenome]|uniref:Uncharacterized protein n=1 Tax=marine sediment metagenome TaxID=412755 RepID=X1TUH7_9ZZZZ